jgi:AcrR family transcriptional regulator
MDRDKRKEQLAEAVWQVIRDRGIGAVSIRSVAAQAGVVVGSLRHVFPTRAELLRFSAELMTRRATERIMATELSGDPRTDAMEIIKHLLPLNAESRAELEVNLALIAEAPAQPELIEIRDHVHQQLGELCVRLVGALAGPLDEASREDRARRLHALIDGLALHLLTRPPAEDPGWAIEILRREITDLARTGHPGA